MTRPNYRRAFLALVVTSALAVALPVSARLAATGGAEVGFLAIGPAGLKINGKGSELSVAERDGKLLVKAPLTDLKTGIGLRDRHLRGHLETDKYPEAKLVVARAKLKMPANHETVKGNAVGKLSLHGVTKPLKFRYKAKRTGSDYHVQGLTEIDIRDFGVEVPCYLGVCVDPTVKIKVRFKLREKK